MKTVAIVNGVIFAIITVIAIYIGLDLKKWQSWLFCVYSFLSAFLFALVSTGNIDESLKGGAIVAFATMFVGVTGRWNRERAKKWLREHYENEE